MDDGKETAEMSGADRISVPQLKRLRKLNRKLHDAGVGRPSDGRRGVRIAVREMLSVCFRLQEPTARVVLQSQIEELEETVASQRTVLRKAGEMAVQAGGGGGGKRSAVHDAERHLAELRAALDMAEVRAAAAREERDRVSKVEAENRGLREAVATLTDWLALAVLGSRAEDDAAVDEMARRIAKSVSQRAAACRTLNATEEQDFVKGILPRGSGKRIARRAAGRL